MPFEQILILGLVAGATIFIGLPLGRIRSAPASVRAFLSAMSVGILLFLFWDVTTAAFEPIEDAMHEAVDGAAGWANFAGLVLTSMIGLGAALLGLVFYDRWIARRRNAGIGPGAASVAEFRSVPSITTPAQLATLIALGIGLHNLAEGLAIGQSAASGQIAFAMTLMLGFALHNATEGFGIVAPLAGQEERPSWSFLAGLGVLAGGPTLLGTLIGQAWVNTTVAVAFLALAAGSILYVIIELIGVNKAFVGLKVLVTAGVLFGLLLGFGTDLFLDAFGG